VAFANKTIELYKDAPFLSQIKAMESYETPYGRIKIQKPTGGRDDMVDSFMMACSPFIKPRGGGTWRFANFAAKKKFEVTRNGITFR